MSLQSPVGGDSNVAASHCPVSRESRSLYENAVAARGPPFSSAVLSMKRETSSIPKEGDGNWVYPSEAQFFAAMARKNYSPKPEEMRAIVPIHNSVNERAWEEILKWERRKRTRTCERITLVKFTGKPKEMSLRARWKMLLGYNAPFDRHDWVVDRCGTRMRYIIDFYAGHNPSNILGSSVSFYLDVRPALDTWEGVMLRFETFWGKLWS